jgi:hypothetical protein
MEVLRKSALILAINHYPGFTILQYMEQQFVSRKIRTFEHIYWGKESKKHLEIHFLKDAFWRHLTRSRKSSPSSCQLRTIGCLLSRVQSIEKNYLKVKIPKTALTFHLLAKRRPLSSSYDHVSVCYVFIPKQRSSLSVLKWQNIKRVWVVEIQIWWRFHDSRDDNFVFATRRPL